MRICLLASLAVPAVAPASAQQLEPLAVGLEPVIEAPPPLPPADRRRHFEVIWDNDAFSVKKGWGSDEWYTNGVRFAWKTAENDLPSGAAWINGALSNFLGPANTRFTLGISQHVYTPMDKTAVNPDPADHPYAGYLYATFGLERRGWNTLDKFEAQIGMTGPYTGAEQLQNAIHDIIRNGHGQGWAYQIKAEPTLNLNAERIWRVPIVTGPFGLGFDVLPSASVMLGNVRTAASVGSRFRFGQGLEKDFGPARIRPGVSDGGPPVGDGFGWYVFLGGAGSGVARDIFIDGNTFVDSRRLTRVPWQAEGEAGFAFLYNGYRFSYTQVYRTREWLGQDRPFTYGAINMNFAF